MSFSYNNRMPFYAWGYNGANNSATLTNPLGYFDTLADGQYTLHLRRDVIPAAELGASGIAQRSGLLVGGPTAGIYAPLYEGSPVDRQLPWRSIVASQIGFLGELRAVGLTMFGELYGVGITAPRTYEPASGLLIRNRRVFRIRTPLASRSFKWIAATAAASPFTACVACVSSLGEAYLFNYVSRRFTLGAAEDEHLISIPLPSGETADKLWLINGSYTTTVAGFSRTSYVLVLATSSEKTFVRCIEGTASTNFWSMESPRYLSDWTLLTTGVVNGLVRSAGTATFPLMQPPPRIVLSAPQLPVVGGVASETARIVALWFRDTAAGKWALSRVHIAHPGSGYTSPPTVSFSPAPSSGTLPTIEFEIFENIVTRQMQDGRFSTLSASMIGDAHYFTVPPTSLVAGAGLQYSGEESDIASRVAVDVSYRTGRSVPAAANNGMFGWVANNSEDYFRSSIGGVADAVMANGTDLHVLANDGKLYKVTASGPQLVSGGEWVSIAQASGTLAAVNKDGGLYTWGSAPGLYGDGTTAVRNSPVRVAPEIEWVNCFGSWGSRPLFVAIRKDATCQSIDQPMLTWPDEYFEFR